MMSTLSLIISNMVVLTAVIMFVSTGVHVANGYLTL